MSYTDRIKMKLEAMSNLRPADTGVEGAIIWVSAGEFEGKQSQHAPRIKVIQGVKIATDGDTASVSIEDEPKVVQGELPAKLKKQAIDFVKLNKNTLLKYWNLEISTAEMIQKLKSI